LKTWRTLTAGIEMDKAIAKRLGYRVKKVHWTPAAPTHRGWMYALTDPSTGEHAAFGAETKAAAWQLASRHQRESSAVFLPHFSTDAHVPLPLEEGEEIEIHELWTGNCAAMVRQPLLGTQSELMEGVTLAEARCLAWLAWHDCKTK
jgi:hypothetical protein